MGPEKGVKGHSLGQMAVPPLLRTVCYASSLSSRKQGQAPSQAQAQAQEQAWAVVGARDRARQESRLQAAPWLC